MKLTNICLMLALALSSNCFCQQLSVKQRTQITAGVSTTDATNVGVRYHIKQSQLWLNLGVNAIGRNTHFITVGPGFSHHLWGSSKHTDLKPWYIKPALTGVSYALPYTRLTTEHARTIYAKLHIGRDFNISKRVGFTVSLGPSARIYHRWNRPDERESKIDLINYASFDLSGFCRLQKIQ